MAVTFKCLTSGQTVTFEAQVDIDSMKGHEGYEVVTEEVQEPVVAKKTASKKAVDTVTTEEV
jgi:hypothetical protein